jgi:hypothetical protein
VFAACAHTDVSLNAGAGSHTAAGTSAVSSGAGLQVNASGGLAAAIVAGVVIAGTAHDVNNPPPATRYESFSDWFWVRPTPTMDPDRTVSEQDCTKPIATSGNLKCR